MKTARFLMAKGFTLVELLIVIALIGILAVAILAAINPLEQLNRARDTGMESDASQLLAAIDRYYASHEEFPWVTEDSSLDNDSAFGFITAQDGRVGICDYDETVPSSDCTTGGGGGVLLTDLELKSEFLNRNFVVTTIAKDMLYVGKALGASSSVYGCWVPSSNAKRKNANYQFTLNGSIYDRSEYAGTAASCSEDPATTWADIASSCFVCIPH